MLYNKQKRFIKYILVGLVFCLSLALFNSGKVLPTKAFAYNCDPNSAPCCLIPQDKGGGIGPCFGPDGSKIFPVANNTDKSPEPEKGQCYALFGPNYVVADCAGDPFNVSTTKYTSGRVDCSTVDKDHCGIIRWLIIFINLLSALVGLVITAVIVIAGIQFSAAGNDPQKVAAARGHIVNALLALVTFIFMYAFLQWIVPGGIF